MRIDEAAELTAEATAAEQRLSGLGVSPGIAIGPAYLSEGGDLQVHESHIPKPGSTPNGGALPRRWRFR